MDGFIDEFVKLLMVAFAATVTPLVVAVLLRVCKKVGLDVSAQQEARLTYHVQRAILEAEERVEDQIKRRVMDKAAAPIAKLNRATEAVIRKLPNVTPAEAEALVKRELPAIGLGAAGFLKAVRQASESK